MPLPRGTNKTDSQRKTQNKYDQKHYKTAACKISIEKYQAFQKYAEERKKTIAGLLSEYINQCLSDKTGQE